MSYVRWSTIINPRFNYEQIIQLLSNGVSWKRIDYLNSRNREKSKWYIFWHACSGDTIEDQYLAVWLAGDNTLPIISYKVVRDLIAYGHGEILGLDKELPQIDILRSCLVDWANDVESEFEET